MGVTMEEVHVGLQVSILMELSGSSSFLCMTPVMSFWERQSAFTFHWGLSPSWAVANGR
jgi:hypothetical protein